MKKIGNRLFERIFNYGKFAIVKNRIKSTEIGRFGMAKQIFQTASGKLLTVSGFAAAEAQLVKMNFAHSVCKILGMNKFSTQCVEN